MRRSGLFVPGERRRIRRAHVAATLLALVAFAQPIAGAVSSWSRAALDVVTVIRTVVGAEGEGLPSCGP